MTLVWPARQYLDSYVRALRRGWSPDNVRGLAASQEELKKIATDPEAFLKGLVDREATGDPIILADGTSAARLPGYQRWMWDGEFCGTIGFRWQNGTEALPASCLGHIGYAVVPWKARRGYATSALTQLLPEAMAEGLRYVDLTTSPTNVASQRVILANGGVLVETFVRSPSQGGTLERRYRIDLRERPFEIGAVNGDRA